MNMIQRIYARTMMLLIGARGVQGPDDLQRLMVAEKLINGTLRLAAVAALCFVAYGLGVSNGRHEIQSRLADEHPLSEHSMLKALRAASADFRQRENQDQNQDQNQKENQQ